MKIYLTRHGQTNLNKEKLMQGSIDEPLNETGINQAKETGLKVAKVKFDAVFSSPLGRAIDTASLISGVSKENIIIDKRLTEVSFGPYEKRPYSRLGLHMTAFWLLPEVIKPPKGVETISSMVKRSSEYLKEVESKGYENVLIVCHGGIIRALRGYLEERKNGIKWRPKPKNCEISVYEYENGRHKFLESIK